MAATRKCSLTVRVNLEIGNRWRVFMGKHREIRVLKQIFGSRRTFPQILRLIFQGLRRLQLGLRSQAAARQFRICSRKPVLPQWLSRVVPGSNLFPCEALSKDEAGPFFRAVYGEIVAPPSPSRASIGRGWVILQNGLRCSGFTCSPLPIAGKTQSGEIRRPRRCFSAPKYPHAVRLAHIC
jgi:hypothetical protein